MTETNGIGDSGYDLEALSAYADRGRTPAIAAIDADPECLAVLDSIERLGTLTRELVADDAERMPPPDENWIRALLESITREVRAGRDIPFPESDDTARFVVTEGAVRQLLREAGDAVPGVLVGRVGLRVTAAPGAGDDGSGTTEATPALDRADVDVRISVAHGTPLAAAADAVRAAASAALLRSTPLEPGAIDVTIDDIHLPDIAADPAAEEERA
ncbi:Asp23/Gls24 family envelope stress response protein [Schumannella sp. 10F1B-5-1]|uniref:Asp23/Gls24 family envelope stress response protein n=1 Tax=Schumannella sp. 10F1B-5-1 TaxID=2590780 RepID=UPI0011316C55|nr:Asp23/Gls24 family envelope stress response protein [Schumannella sp. 10F1B-5-1]TPW71675.1 Asp23/Gls24 family envelope stress response protein [Schumannella sp. 10F1B-5-1]